MVNGGTTGGSFASCFQLGPGVACGAVSAILTTAVDQMYEVLQPTRFSIVHVLRHDLQVHIDFKSSSAVANPLDAFGSSIGTSNM
jgi:hypothetical protein